MGLFSHILMLWVLAWTFIQPLYVCAQTRTTSNVPIPKPRPKANSNHFGIGNPPGAQSTETTSNVPVPGAQSTEVTPKVASFEVQKQTGLYVGLVSPGSGFRFSSHGKIGKYCLGPDQYFTGDGRLGKKGLILKRELMGAGRSTPMKHLFFRNSFPGMEGVCPKFNSFNDHEKLNFWIWYFAAIAATESDCGRNEYYPNDPNGVSVGELQVPEAYRNRKWRGLKKGAGGCEADPPKERPQSYRYKRPPKLFMASLKNNLSCGVEILGGVLCGFYKHPIERCNKTTSRPYGNGFWKHIRRGKRGKIIKDVKRFPLCN